MDFEDLAQRLAAADGDSGDEGRPEAHESAQSAACRRLDLVNLGGRQKLHSTRHVKAATLRLLVQGHANTQDIHLSHETR